MAVLAFAKPLPYGQYPPSRPTRDRDPYRPVALLGARRAGPAFAGAPPERRPPSRPGASRWSSASGRRFASRCRDAMKANKHRTLWLVHTRHAVRARDLVEQFGYSADTARSYLSLLARHGLLEHVGAGYALTQKGHDRLHFFDVSGCSDPRCPRCEGKTGYLTCPRCGHRMLKRTARILKAKDFVFVKRHQASTAIAARS